jgi:hypothetical protein
MESERHNQVETRTSASAPDLASDKGRVGAPARSSVHFQVNKTIAMLLATVPALAGCASHQIGPNRPVPIETDVAMVSSLAYPQDLTTFAANWPDKGAARNEMLTARMYVADMEYQVYEANLTKEMQDEGLLGTATILGLTTSSTLVGAVATKTILSALATGVTGLDKAYNEKELLSNAMQAMQTQMRADRNAQAAQIYAKMFTTDKKPTPISQYTWTMALSDAEAYYQAGTLTSALVGLSKTTAKAAENAAAAKAAAGPNSLQVTAAQENASPSYSVTIPASRAVFVAPVSTPKQKVQAPPVVKRNNPDGKNQFELTLQKETILDYQKELCAPQDKDITSLRSAIVDFFNKADDSERADHIKSKGILPADLDEIDKLARPCQVK